MKKKSYSVIIAIALIAVLIVAMICMLVSKDTNEDVTNPNENQSGEVLPGVSESTDLPGVEVNVERDDEGNKINVSEEINTEKMSFDFIDLTDIAITYEDGEGSLYANVKNNSDKDYPDGVLLSIKFYNEEGSLLAELAGLTGSVKANGESNIRSKSSNDFSNATRMEVSILN